MSETDVELLELARLCLRQARVARTPAAAAELQRMAEDYFTRATVLAPDLQPTDAGPTRSGLASAQQQQQPQPEFGSRHRSVELQQWRDQAEDLRAQAALLEDGAARLLMLHMAETYDRLARRAIRGGD